jgi:hypothetical protein
METKKRGLVRNFFSLLVISLWSLSQKIWYSEIQRFLFRLDLTFSRQFLALFLPAHFRAESSPKYLRLSNLYAFLPNKFLVSCSFLSNSSQNLLQWGTDIRPKMSVHAVCRYAFYMHVSWGGGGGGVGWVVNMKETVRINKLLWNPQPMNWRPVSCHCLRLW